MSDVSQDVKNLISVIIDPLVDFPDEVSISVHQDDNENISVDIRVNPDDAGKVIGRQGRLIKSIRTIARAVASREGVGVEVELLD